MNSRTKSPVSCDLDPGRAGHESKRVTFLIGERVRAKARAALFRDIAQPIGLLCGMATCLRERSRSLALPRKGAVRKG
ncbi:unnamed protein product [Withania somnifera]